MEDEFDVYTIKFIEKTDIIKQIKTGASQALAYKITRGKHNFFLKVFKGNINIEKVKESLEIYKKLDIKSLDIIDFGKIDQKIYKCYIVYNYIRGQNLRKRTQNKKYSLKYVRKIGEKIGKDFLKLKTFDKYNKDLYRHDDIDKIISDTTKNLNLILENENYKNIILKYFTIKELEDFNNQLIEYASLFKDIEPTLIHADIKRDNIMVNKKNKFDIFSLKLYITDIESMKISYDVLNFMYIITNSLFEGNEKEAEFIKGYFDGIYSKSRPENFNKTIMFTLIINFFIRLYHIYTKTSIYEFETYVYNCKKVFDKISKINMDAEYIF